MILPKIKHSAHIALFNTPNYLQQHLDINCIQFKYFHVFQAQDIIPIRQKYPIHLLLVSYDPQIQQSFLLLEQLTPDLPKLILNDKHSQTDAISTKIHTEYPPNASIEILEEIIWYALDLNSKKS